MMYRALQSSLIKLTVGLVFSLSSVTAVGQGGEYSSGEAFQIGSSCAGLGYLSKQQLSTVISAALTDDMHSFCYPEEPSECSDYTDLLQGVGRLTTGDDDFHCALEF